MISLERLRRRYEQTQKEIEDYRVNANMKMAHMQGRLAMLDELIKAAEAEQQTQTKTPTG